MRYKLTIEYDGAPYCGWQKQAGLPTVQGEIETAFFLVFQEKVDLGVAGRTDAGVHAAGQVAHVDLAADKGLSPFEIGKAINAHLGGKLISIVDVEAVDDAFNARFDARKKLYRYAVLNRAAPPSLETKVWHVRAPLDHNAMHEAAQKLLGRHDFTSYRDKECQAKTPLRTMERLDFRREGDVVIFEAEAQSFLHHQIRNFMGTFVLVGLGKEDKDFPWRVLCGQNRALAGQTAPPQGLTLVKIWY